MKKRIFSLAMVCLFILTTLSAISAFATEGVGSSVVVGEQTVINSWEYSDANVKATYPDYAKITVGKKGQYATYDVNVEKTSKYDISVYFSYISHESYKFDVYVDDVLAVSGTELGSKEKGTYKIGTVTLTPDTKTIKIQQSSDYASEIKYVYIDAANQIGNTKAELGALHAASYTGKYQTDNSTAGDYISTEGRLQTLVNKEVVYDIILKEDGYYSFSMYAGDEAYAEVRYNFDVDEDAIISHGYIAFADISLTSLHATKHQLPIVKLAKGTHTVKFKVVEGQLDFYALCIEKVSQAHNVSYEEETILSAKGDLAYSSANAIQTDNATEGITNTDGRLYINNDRKAVYLINVEETGQYNIGVIAGCTSERGINLTTESGTIYQKFTPGEASDTYGTKLSFGSVQLNKGLQIIEISVAAANPGSYVNWYLYGITFENAATKLSTTQKIMVCASDFSSKSTGDANEVHPDYTTSDGIITKGMVVMRAGFSYSYLVNVPESGNYKLSTVSGGYAIRGTVEDGNGNVLLEGYIAEASPENAFGYASETEAGVITLSKGINTITINAISATTYFYGLYFKFVPPSVAVYEGEIADNLYAIDVVPGTMSVKVDLNGYLTGKTALVVFAVYETDTRGIKSLYKVYAETVAGGNTTVTGAVNDIVVDDEKVYTVKVFMLDSQTLIGKVINYIE